MINEKEWKNILEATNTYSNAVKICCDNSERFAFLRKMYKSFEKDIRYFKSYPNWNITNPKEYEKMVEKAKEMVKYCAENEVTLHFQRREFISKDKPVSHFYFEKVNITPIITL